MTYVWIFAGCYVIALVVLVTDFRRKNNIAAARLRENAASPDQVANFHRMVTRQSVLPLAWASFSFGSVAGGVISAIYWAVM